MPRRPVARLGSWIRPRRASALAVLAATVAVAGCSGNQESDFTPRSVNELYNEAQDAMVAGQYSDAAEAFEEVDRQHPYSRWARRAQLMAGYAYYQGRAYNDAVLALERYIELYPGAANIGYARYLRARCFYERISDVERDQGMTERADRALRTVVERHSDSDYARDARAKLDLTRNHQAGKHMAVGRYHQDRDFQGQAIRRFNRVLGDFPKTPQVPEALMRLTESYLALGLDAEAYRSASVLGHNFPGSDWYDRAYALLEKHGLVAEPPADLGEPAKGPALARPDAAPGPGQGLEDIPAPRPPQYRSRPDPEPQQSEEQNQPGPGVPGSGGGGGPGFP